MAYYKSEHCLIEGAVEIGDDVSIWHYAVVRAEVGHISIGAGTNVQDGAVLHTDEGYPLSIGAGVTIGHRAIVHGCSVGDDVLIGMGAIIMNGARIGSGSVIAAGAVVTEGCQIPPNSLVMGIPGKVRSTVRPEQRRQTAVNAERYIAHAKKRLKCVE